MAATPSSLSSSATRRRFVALVGALLLLLSCKRESTRVEIGLAIPSYAHAIAWLAAERGHFQRLGIDAHVETTGGSAAAIRTLITARIDVALAGGDAVLKANASGADVVAVAGLVGRFYHRVVARAGVDDLRGRKIGLPFLGGPQDMAIEVALRDARLTRDDVEIITLGKDFNGLAAIAAGEIDVTTSEVSPARLAELGLHVIADLPASTQPFPYLVVAVRRSALDTARTRVLAVVQGLCDALREAQDDSLRDELLAVITPHLGDAHAQASWAEAGPPTLSYPPLLDLDGFASVVNLAGLDPTLLQRSVDTTVVEDLQAEGHCR